MSAVDLMKTETVYTEAWNRLRPILERCDALLCPTEAIPAPTVDYDELGSMGDDADGRHQSMDMTMQFNALKLPALSGPQASPPTGCPRPADRRPALRRPDGAPHRRRARRGAPLAPAPPAAVRAGG